MNLVKPTILLLALVSLYSCGNGKGEVTKTNFVFSSAIANIGGQTGGIMVFGTNKTTAQSVRFVLTEEPVELENGVWDFIYASWDGSNTNLGTTENSLEGVVRCGQNLGINLNGGETPISMVLSTAGCASPFFGASSTKNAGTGSPKPLEIYGCSNNGVFGPEGGNTSDCKFSPAESFQVFLPELLPDGSVRPGLESRCIENSSAFPSAILDNATAHQINLPMFLPVIGRPVVGIRIFEGTNCETLISQTRISHLYATEFAGDPFNLEDDTASSTNELLVKVNVCNSTAGNNPATPFSFEAGKFTICTKDQFSYVASDPASEYFVERDIDFLGQSFTGSVISALTVGLIDGQEHTLSNFTLTDDGTNATGFVGDLSGRIQNLNFTDVNLNCSSNATGAGVVAGVATASAELANIGIENISIDSDDCQYVGGLLGYASSGTGGVFREIKAQNISIDIDETSNSIGGLFGKVTNDFLIFNIEADSIQIDDFGPQSSGSFNYGGIVGVMDGTSTNVSNVLATNIDIGQNVPLNFKDNIGLFAGKIGDAAIDGSTVSSVKVQGNITVGNMAYFVGGITGFVYTSNMSNLIADISIQSASDHVGGAFGFVADDAGLITSISEVRTFGDLSCNSFCGGVIGESVQQAIGTRLSRALSFVDISSSAATSAVGGIIGGASGGTYDSLQFEGSVTSLGDKVGGIVGQVANTSISIFSNIVSLGSVSGNSEVGGIAGNFDRSGAGAASDFLFTLANSVVSATGIEFNYDFGTFAGTANPGSCFIVDKGAGVGIDQCNIKTPAEMTSLASISGTIAASTDLESDIAFIDGGGVSQVELAIAKSIKEIGGVSSLGSFQDPFSVSTKDQWNQIGDSTFYMNKSFRLDADIDFNFTQGDFKPVGSIANPFKGRLFGNNFGLKNIYFKESSSTDPVGIFRVIEATQFDQVSINDIRAGDTSYRRLYIENAHFEYDGAAASSGIGVLAGSVKDYNDGTTRSQVEIGGIDILNATVITNSTDTTSGIGGLFGNFEFGSSETRIEQVKITDIQVDSSSSSGLAGAGGFIGSITKNVNIGASTANVDGVQLYNAVVNGGTIQNNVGGFAGLVVNDRLEIEDSIFEGINLTGVTAVGGLMGSAIFSSVRNTAIKNIDITSSDEEVGGLVGEKGGAGAANIEGVYVLANSIVGTIDVACAFGSALGTINIANSYFICQSVTGSPSSYFSGGLGGISIGPANSVFYVGPTNESIPDVVYLPDDSTLRSPSAIFAASSGTFLSLDPWIFKPGELPITVAEEFPQFFFY